MVFEKFIEKNLGHVSYIFGDDKSKEVVIVDPKRDIEDYVDYIENNDLILMYILNTHTHADYVGGHLELINKYPNAKNIFHKDVPADFSFIKVKENDIFSLGENIKFKILETPGHTPYCISCIVNEDNIDKYIFTGDILFVGDIARPDLLGKELLKDLLNMSYNTANKLWNLQDDLILFTSHIKGSLCGKDLKNQYFSTIGVEKKINKSFALCQKSKEEYINNLNSQNLETPIFFKKMAKMNIAGPKLLKDLEEPKYLDNKEFFKNYNKQEDYIIDFRHPNCFKGGHVEGSINVYEYSNITLILGSLLDNDSKLFFVGDKKIDLKKIVIQLRRIGFDNIFAILNKDVNELENLASFENIIANQKNEKTIINLDTSTKNGDLNIEISNIKNLNLNNDMDYEIICNNGYKSMAVKSFLLKLKNNKRGVDYDK